MHHETRKKVLPSVLILYLLAVRQNMFGRYDSTVELGSVKLKPGFNAELQINHPWECGAISPKDEVENSEFSKISETSENTLFEVSSPPRLPFCTIPKTENSKMKTSGFSLRHFDQTLRYFDQTPRFSIFEVSVWGIVQKRNLEVGKTRSLIKIR